jgi:hypothetical protein
MINELRFKRDSFLDLPARIKSKLHTYLNRSAFPGGDKSDSEQLEYADFIETAISDDNAFSIFRRNYAYRQILEHVSYQLGKKYQSKFEKLGNYPPNLSSYVSRVDQVGNPRTYSYPGIGKVSPTTLRYLATASEICEIFDLSKISSLVVAEIGIGFGGQFLALNQMVDISAYRTFDLKNVQELTNRYVSMTNLMPDYGRIISHQDIENVSPLNSDLLISNYALSELPSKIQLEYIEKIARNAKCGYLTMNSGKSNKTGRSAGKLLVSDFLSAIPGAEIFPENPLSGPDNYLLLWGHKKSPSS